MDQKKDCNDQDSRNRLTRVYISERPKMTARIRAAGRTWEEAEDLIQDIYADTWGRLDRLVKIINLPAWLNALVTRRLIDLWRHDKVRRNAGETDVAEETLRELIAGTGLNPLDTFVRDSMTDALNEAIKALPSPQKKVIEAQVFGGMTFAELALYSGENIDTLKARKRSAVKTLTRALSSWIND